MKAVGKVLLKLVQGVLMAFGLITILYAIYMQAREKLARFEQTLFADEDCGSDFPNPAEPNTTTQVSQA